jgi:hypothetical protein
LDIGICDLFVIWCLEFVLLNTKRHGTAGYLTPAMQDRLGPKDQVFQSNINYYRVLKKFSNKFPRMFFAKNNR